MWVGAWDTQVVGTAKCSGYSGLRHEWARRPDLDHVPAVRRPEFADGPQVLRYSEMMSYRS